MKDTDMTKVHVFCKDDSVCLKRYMYMFPVERGFIFHHLKSDYNGGHTAGRYVHSVGVQPQDTAIIVSTIAKGEPFGDFTEGQYCNRFNEFYDALKAHGCVVIYVPHFLYDSAIILQNSPVARISKALGNQTRLRELSREGHICFLPDNDFPIKLQVLLPKDAPQLVSKQYKERKDKDDTKKHSCLIM